MNRLLLIISLFYFVVFITNAQDSSTEKRWNDIQERISYKSSSKPAGPDKKYISPADMDDEEYTPNSGTYSKQQNGNNGSTQNYNSGSITRSRTKKYGNFKQGSGNGSGPVKKKIQKSGSGGVPSIPIKDVDIPDIDLPDVDIDIPDVDVPSVGMGFWKILLIILGVLLLAFLAYHLFLKNANTEDLGKTKILREDEEWDPTQISKTELELKLEAAIEREDYRECVRIYYTFILKELITKGWIKWERKKTNIHYLIEMASRKESYGFNKSVNIFELVWYGDYAIEQKDYKQIEPDLKSFYQNLEATNG